MPLIGAHVHSDDPLGDAAAFGADLVQVFQADPQGWKKPEPHPQAEALAEAGVGIYVHAPYIVNVASLNNKIRIPSRKLLSQHAAAAAAAGAQGLIVHGGHVRQGEDVAEGLVNWKKTFERETFPVPILIENTAGGDNAMARTFDMLARLWDTVGDYGVGLCLDTCHAFSAGEPLEGIAERVLAITGRIDLVHANGSRDEFASGRDRHANYADSTIAAETVAGVISAAGAPAICETPAEGVADDIATLRKLLD